jgi:hypothetical protein
MRNLVNPERLDETPHLDRPFIDEQTLARAYAEE